MVPHRPVSSRIPRQVPTVLLYFWLVGVSQIFGYTSGNPFGVLGVNEAFFALAMAVAGFDFLRGRFTKAEIIIFVAPIAGCVSSAIIAQQVYGQPLYLGIVEERRMLFLYFYFPLRDLAVSLGYERCRRALTNVALFCAFLGIAYILGFVTGWKSLGTSFQEAERANFGSFLVACAIILGFRRDQIWKTALLILFLVFVAQSRQVIIAVVAAMMLSTLLIAYKQGQALIVSAIVAAIILVLAPIVLFPAEAISLLPKAFQELFSDQYLAASARSRAYDAVFEDFRYIGHGALSSLYFDGFARFYGEAFFLADIGIVGTIHRFGFLAILYILMTARIILLIWRRAAVADPTVQAAIVAVTASLLVTWPTAGILEYRGAYVGLLAAFALGAAQRKQPAHATQSVQSAPSYQHGWQR